MVVRSLDYADKFAITHILPNIAYGSNWGFCSNEDYDLYLRNIERANGNQNQIKGFVLKSKSGVVLTANEVYLTKLAHEVTGGDWNEGDQSSYRQQNSEGIYQFKSFLDRLKDGYEGFIGVNEVTDATEVVVSQIVYPSFKIDLNLVWFEMIKRAREGLTIQFLNTKNEWETLTGKTNSEEFKQSFTVSPTRNCIVLPVKIKE